MKGLLRVVKYIVEIIIAFILGMILITMIRIYKPVFDASKKIDEVSEYAMTVEDELVNKDVKVIGFGEAAHGNKEFQQLKLDVLKTLVRDNGISAVAFELDYGEGVLINDYICGKSDMSIEELFSHISFGIYHTEETKALIEWMKEYNEQSRDGKLEFYGYDLQNPEQAVYMIDAYVKKHGINISSDAIESYVKKPYKLKNKKAKQLFADLKAYKKELKKDQYKNYDDIDKVITCIDNVFTTKKLAAISLSDSNGYGTFRDQAMKDNVEDISNAVGYPIVVMGHNGHVGYAGSYVKTMGAYLKEDLGDEYFVIGTDYFKTTCSMNSAKGRGNHKFCSADPLAYQAKQQGTYYLRFDDVKDNERLNNLVHNKMYTGSLGEGYSFLNQLAPNSVRVNVPARDLYDGMIFVYEATPFTLLEY